MNTITRSSLFLLLLATHALPAAAEEYVCLDTNRGDICFSMLPEVAPFTVANFLRYIDRGAFANTLVHRSVPGFVIQGGGFSANVNNFGEAIATEPPVVSEVGRSNLRGTLAMARLSGLPNSANSQWYINLADNLNLDTIDGGFTVFGTVVQGMDVVDGIAALRVGDFSLVLNSFAFEEMPVDMAPNETDADVSDFVIVERGYRTERLPGLLPYQCSLTSPGDTLTEFCGGAVTFPVQVDGVLYEGTLDLIPGRSDLVFSVDESKLKLLTDTGQQRATFAANVLTIPSVRTGAQAYNDVKLNLTNNAPLEFTVVSFTQR